MLRVALLIHLRQQKGGHTRMKAVRIIFNTGVADENGKPILKRSTL